MDYFVATFKELPKSYNLEFSCDTLQFKSMFEENDNSFDVSFGEFQFVHDMPEGILLYDGSYVVTPKTEAQELETKDRLMIADTQINAIPYYEVSNDSGHTVFIASEL